MNHPQRTIEIIITANGQTSIRTKGFAGQSCRDATRSIERGLGETSGEQLTPEFYLTQPAHEQNRTQN